ncbi:MAG: thiamine pyrophosphate-requiring protein [Chloroflexota bacterium]|nr:thiamine pyrophosphate-requiring protein [Chloroflexota bacterium]
MKGNAAVARILKREGVEFLFCFPSNPLIEACAREGICPILARTERTVLAMADGYTRVHNGRKIGVCAVQRASGSENTFGGVAQVYSDSTPILVLPGGNPRRRQHVPYSFDATDHYRNTTKWVDSVNFADRIPEMMRRAFSALRNGRGGPVMVEIPADVGQEEVDDAAIDGYRSPRVHRSMASPDDVEAAARALVEARRPVILAGQGVLYAEATEELRELAELLAAPVVATMNGKSAFPEDHPLSLGAAGASSTEASARFLERSDLIFGIGASFSANTYSHPLPADKTMVQLTTYEGDLNKDHPTDVGLVGDARLVLRQVIDAVRERLGGTARDAGPAAAEIASIKASWLEAWMPRLSSDDAPISPYRVIYEMNRVFDRQASIVTHDAGNPRDQMLPFYEALAPRGYLGWGKSTHLGWGYGLGMGAKLAAPDKLVANFMGDAAFGMTGMEVETAAREKIGLLTVLVNNQGMGGYPAGYPTAVEQFNFSNLTGQYAKLAESLGAYGERIERAADVAPALQRAGAITMDGRPALLEIMTRQEPVLSRFGPRNP